MIVCILYKPCSSYYHILIKYCSIGLDRGGILFVLKAVMCDWDKFFFPFTLDFPHISANVGHAYRLQMIKRRAILSNCLIRDLTIC